MIIYTQHTPYCEQLLTRASVYYQDDCTVTSFDILGFLWAAIAIALVIPLIRALWRGR